MDLVLVVFLLVIDDENVIGMFGVWYLVGRTKDIVSLWRISDSRTQPKRKYQHFVHCSYNNSFFWICLFIIHWIIFIFSIPKLFVYSIFLLDVLFMYLVFLVNVIVYLLFYHWISIL